MNLYSKKDQWQISAMCIKGNIRVIIMIVTLMFLSVVYIIKHQHLNQLTTFTTYTYSRENYNGNTEVRGFLVYNPRCKLPDLDPWNKSIRTFFKSPTLLHCSNRPLLSVIKRLSNGSYVLRIEKKAKKSYSKLNADKLTCCYSEIIRISETLENYDMEADNKFRYSKCHKFQDEITLPGGTEFIKVKCTLKKNRKTVEVYTDAHAVVPMVPSALNKIKDFAKTIDEPMRNKSLISQNSFKNRTRLNVVIVGIDSVSRLNLRRMMPNTFKYLKQNEWIEFNGYTKIADNTFPNLMAILSGLHMRDLQKICYQNRSHKLDDCPYIWRQFNKMGYVTAYAEDTPNISTFNYLRTGFVEKPTDYYLRPFMLAVHSSLTQKKAFGLPVCVGPVASVDHILNYARRFLETFNDHRHFSLFWQNSLSHNNPTMTANMDKRTRDFLQDLSDIGTYDNSLVILLSDHGTRFGDFRHTFVGYYEERLPFIFMSFPKWFRKEHPRLYDNLQINQKRLTCPYDVHLTLRKILNEDFSEVPADKLSACPECMSLFERVPWERGCQDAAIDDVWCMCGEFKEHPIAAPMISKLGTFVKDSVVNLTKKLVQQENINSSVCATWTLVKVVRAHEIIMRNPRESNDTDRTGIAVKQFVVLVELNPGKTRFEAVVEVTKTNGEDPDNLSIKYAPSILDGYSKFSDCVQSPSLRYYCYCTSMIT